MTPEEFEVSVDLQVRFRDLDAMGHVNNAVYLTYLEMARVEYWKRLMGKVSADAYRFIIARIELDYLAPVALTDELSCCIGLTEIGGSSFRFEYLLYRRNDGRAAARAVSVQVGYDYQAGKVVPLDPGFRRLVTALRSGKGLPPPAAKPSARQG